MIEKKRLLTSLRLNIGTAFMLIVFFSCLLLGTVIFLSLRTFVRNGIRERLRDIASVAVLQVNADVHRLIRTKSDESTPGFIQLKKTLQTIRKSSPDLRYVYTMRKVNDKLEFVVDAEENVDEMSHVGDVYDKSSSEMLAAFRWPYKVRVEKKMITDKWGTFISSYAPFFTSNGQLEGILGMDMQASHILAYEKRLLFIITLVSFITAAIFASGGIIYSRTIAKPLVNLSGEMHRIEQLELDRRLSLCYKHQGPGVRSSQSCPSRS